MKTIETQKNITIKSKQNKWKHLKSQKVPQ